MKYNNGEKIEYGAEGKVGNTYTCFVNRNEGSVKFIHNNKDLGVAFADEAIKVGPLYFAVSCGGKGQSVRIVKGGCEAITNETIQ